MILPSFVKNCPELYSKSLPQAYLEAATQMATAPEELGLTDRDETIRKLITLFRAVAKSPDFTHQTHKTFGVPMAFSTKIKVNDPAVITEVIIRKNRYAAQWEVPLQRVCRQENTLRLIGTLCLTEKAPYDINRFHAPVDEYLISKRQTHTADFVTEEETESATNALILTVGKGIVEAWSQVKHQR